MDCASPELWRLGEGPEPPRDSTDDVDEKVVAVVVFVVVTAESGVISEGTAPSGVT